MLKEHPFTPRPKVDIKKLKDRDKVMYRLRIGDYRFEYFVEEKAIYVVEGFRREEVTEKVLLQAFPIKTSTCQRNLNILEN
jgi:mRNA-degrading endonuclease RelE of RelBE toxin-antitoxin system